ncbi:response regulator [Salinimicrobium xinjiangense]|uniref:response regulator n=1 Tax=Salinimicrobium xinjiangense TaxID=438596 RepID=UPI00042031E6|nr:response regulator [Salinimicrobium xinjiangense]
MEQLYHYLVVDDDKTSNLICDFTIQRFNSGAQRNLFTRPEEALEYILGKGLRAGITVLFLDVNMPTMSGFEFLGEFEKLPREVQEQYKIYMLTSSIEDFSSQAEKFTCVQRFLSKPMKLSYLQEIALEIELIKL